MERKGAKGIAIWPIGVGVDVQCFSMPARAAAYPMAMASPKMLPHNAGSRPQNKACGGNKLDVASTGSVWENHCNSEEWQRS